MSDDTEFIFTLTAKIVRLEYEVAFLRRHYAQCPYAGGEWWCMHDPEHVDTDCYEADGNTPAGGAGDLIDPKGTNNG